MSGWALLAVLVGGEHLSCPPGEVWSRERQQRVTVALQTEVERAIRQREPLAVIACDLDHFKRVNDTLGHAAGDEVLRTLAQRLRQATRRYDVVGRVGGEEFLLLLPGCDARLAVRVAERARELVASKPFSAQGVPVRATMSFGVAVLASGERVEGVDRVIETLLEAADQALYSAKRAGRNRVQLVPQPQALVAVES